ncbi:PQ loop repeat protein [Paecilomyces variotii No. 5]|uniref:PQ loop repeat protein n=1 Tax=Byssochlamys spectabilis (strain No. 5 / NBRC 109023) TaxID=1356009 RepID=V5FJR6_BYSSN|nr:PQ loop repeat protein [Paecilomyces variotii No. 5]
MFPPQAGNIDVEALSGICGSISIACWVVVFSPQIIENFRRSSADGLSVLFVVVWLAGDVFNILGAMLQGVLPTMIILAVYYTLADIVLLGQCFYYRGFTLSDDLPAKDDRRDRENGTPTERSALLGNNSANGNGHANGHHGDVSSSLHPQVQRRLSTTDATHLSPATPFIEPSVSQAPSRKPSALQAFFFNSSAIVLVCAAGILGWYVSSRSISQHTKKHKGHGTQEPLTFDTWGQIFGYLCAALYLGSRLPQLLLNYRRKSTEGVSMLFFLFACIGNLTFVLSIFAYSPSCQDGKRHCRPGEAASLYGRYILVNLSWLLGSLGTLLLDLAIFVQFFLYRKDEDEERITA